MWCALASTLSLGESGFLIFVMGPIKSATSVSKQDLKQFNREVIQIVKRN